MRCKTSNIETTAVSNGPMGSITVFLRSRDTFSSPCAVLNPIIDINAQQYLTIVKSVKDLLV